MASDPVFVFVPGAWHTPKSFTPVLKILTSSGYELDAVSLPSVGAETRNEAPVKSWDPDVEAVRKAVLSHLDQGKDVILVCHSYGGAPASQAVRGLSKKAREEQGRQGAVIRIVYIAGLLVKIGSYLWESTGGKPWLDVIRVEVNLRAAALRSLDSPSYMS